MFFGRRRQKVYDHQTVVTPASAGIPPVAKTNADSHTSPVAQRRICGFGGGAAPCLLTSTMQEECADVSLVTEGEDSPAIVRMPGSDTGRDDTDEDENTSQMNTTNRRRALLPADTTPCRRDKRIADSRQSSSSISSSPATGRDSSASDGITTKGSIPLSCGSTADTVQILRSPIEVTLTDGTITSAPSSIRRSSEGTIVSSPTETVTSGGITKIAIPRTTAVTSCGVRPPIEVTLAVGIPTAVNNSVPRNVAVTSSKVRSPIEVVLTNATNTGSSSSIHRITEKTSYEVRPPTEVTISDGTTTATRGRSTRLSSNKTDTDSRARSSTEVTLKSGNSPPATATTSSSSSSSRIRGHSEHGSDRVRASALVRSAEETSPPRFFFGMQLTTSVYNFGRSHMSANDGVVNLSSLPYSSASLLRGFDKAADIVGYFMEHESRRKELDYDQLRDPSCYHASVAPDVPLTGYLARMQRICRIADESFILALIYMHRLCTRGGPPLNRLTAHRLALTATVIATKFFEDMFFTNHCYARVGGVQTAELNKLEKIMLETLDYCLFVEREEFDSVCGVVLKIWRSAHPE